MVQPSDFQRLAGRDNSIIDKMQPGCLGTGRVYGLNGPIGRAHPDCITCSVQISVRTNQRMEEQCGAVLADTRISDHE